MEQCLLFWGKNVLSWGRWRERELTLSFLTKICPLHHSLTKIRYLFKIKYLYFSLHYFLHSCINFGLLFKKNCCCSIPLYTIKGKPFMKELWLLHIRGPRSTFCFTMKATRLLVIKKSHCQMSIHILHAAIPWLNKRSGCAV